MLQGKVSRDEVRCYNPPSPLRHGRVTSDVRYRYEPQRKGEAKDFFAFQKALPETLFAFLVRYLDVPFYKEMKVARFSFR